MFISMLQSTEMNIWLVDPVLFFFLNGSEQRRTQSKFLAPCPENAKHSLSCHLIEAEDDSVSASSQSAHIVFPRRLERSSDKRFIYVPV